MKKIAMMVGVIAAALGVLADTWTDPKTGITWTYTVSDGQASVGGGRYDSPAVPKSTTGAIIIPSTLGGYPVTGIGDSAFRSCTGLTSVTIPSSVTSIGGWAFYRCSGLTTVYCDTGCTSIVKGLYAWDIDVDFVERGITSTPEPKPRTRAELEKEREEQRAQLMLIQQELRKAREQR